MKQMSSRKLPRKISDSSLLALALTGLVGAVGCGDDSPKPALTTETDSGNPVASETASLEPSTDAAARNPDAASSAPAEVDGGVADYDRDGVSKFEGDCDDFNNTIHPGAVEKGLDGLDSDCDGNDGPAMDLVWGAEAEDNKVDALEALDSDEDGSISLEEFAAGCAESAQLLGDSRPGIVQFHASCAGNNSCRGMVLQSWGELYEHSCKASNYCAGWSCVETAEDKGRSASEAYDAGHCGYCHSPQTAEFSIPVPPSENLEQYLADFWGSRSDEQLRSLIAFGVNYYAPDGTAVANMPASYDVLSRAEIDTLIGLLRGFSVEGHYFDLPGLPAPAGDAGDPTHAPDGGSADAAANSSDGG